MIRGITQTIRILITSAAYRRNTAYVLQFAHLFKKYPERKFMLHSAEIVLTFVEALERRCQPDACTR